MTDRGETFPYRYYQEMDPEKARSELARLVEVDLDDAGAWAAALVSTFKRFSRGETENFRASFDLAVPGEQEAHDKFRAELGIGHIDLPTTSEPLLQTVQGVALAASGVVDETGKLHRVSYNAIGFSGETSA